MLNLLLFLGLISTPPAIFAATFYNPPLYSADSPDDYHDGPIMQWDPETQLFYRYSPSIGIGTLSVAADPALL